MREEFQIKRFTTLETFVAMSSSMGCGIAFGTFFSRTLTGRTWMLPGILIGLAIGFCLTFFITPFFVVRVHEHRQRVTKARHAAKQRHPSNAGWKVWPNFPTQKGPKN